MEWKESELVDLKFRILTILFYELGNLKKDSSPWVMAI